MTIRWRRNVGQQPIYSTQGTLQLIGNGVKPVRRTFTMPVPKGRYDVRIKRTSADATGDRETSQTNLLGMRFQQDQVGDVGGQTRVGLKVKASGQLNGAIDQYSAMVRAVCIDAAGYEMYNENPALWFLAIARGYYHPTSGKLLAGAGLPDTQIDIPAIQAWAAFCQTNELWVSGILDTKMSVGEALNKIARVGRGSLSFGTGKLGVVWDAPNLAPVAMFGPHNMLPNTFTINYTAEKTADEVIIRFFNADNDYKPDTLRVTVPGAVTTGQNPVEIDLWGVVYASQVAREANLIAAAQNWRRRRISWETDAEGLIVSRGDVVLLSHDLTSWAASGRIYAASSTTSITLDKPVQGNGAVQYLAFRRPDNATITYHTVAAFTGSSSTLTLTSPLPVQPGSDGVHPCADYVWTFGPTATPGKKVKIVSVEPVGEGQVRLTAVDENPEYYASESDPYSHVPPAPIIGDAPTISNLMLTVAYDDAVGAKQLYMEAVWEITGAAYSEAHVYVNEDSKGFVFRGSTTGRAFSFNIVEGSNYIVKVVAYGTLGTLGASNEITATRDADRPRPPAVSDLVSVTGGTTIDRVEMGVRWLPALWAASYKVTITSGAFSKTVETHLPEFYYTAEDAKADGGPFRTVTFSVVGVNGTGDSSTPATITITNPAPAAPTVTLTAGVNSVAVNTSTPVDADYAGMMVWASTTNGFTPGAGNLVYDGPQTTFVHEGVTALTYYRVAHYDRWGKSNTGSGLNLAAQQSVTPLAIGSGPAGSSNAVVYAYKRSATLPTDNPGAVTYTFASASITTPATDALANGWTKSIPAGSDPLYVIVASASSTSATDSIAAGEWSQPVKLVENGAAGVNGTRTAVLEMYRWSASAPTTFPAGTSTYTWADGQFTAPATLNSWSLTPPAAVAGQTLYVVRAVYADSGTSATSNVTWPASPTPLPVGAAGTSGTNGRRTAVLELYQWAASAPTLMPSGSSTYTWASGAFTAPSTPNSWALTPGAAVAGQTLWACSVVYSDTDTTATSSVSWAAVSASYAVGAAGTNGTNGTNGINTATIFLYRRTATATAPTVANDAVDSVYTFATKALTNVPTGWSTTIPAAAGGAYLWVTQATAASTGPDDTIPDTQWSAVQQLAKDGADGADGKYWAIRAVSNAGSVFVSNAAGTDTVPSSIVVSRELIGGLPSGGTTVWTVLTGTTTNPLTIVNSTTGAPASFTASELTTNTITLRCTYTYSGVDYYDDITLSKVPGSIGGYLDNDSVALPADTAGSVLSYTGASGTFRVRNEAGFITSGLAFTIIGYTGFSGAAYSSPGTSQLSGQITINSTTGAYQVTGGVATGIGNATVTYQCTYTNPLGGSTVMTGVLTITKAPAGAAGSRGVAFVTRASALSAAPTVQATINSECLAALQATYPGATAQLGDSVSLYNTSGSPSAWARTWVYNGTNWLQATLFVDGSAVVTGTLAASAVAAGTLQGHTIQTAPSGARMVLNGDSDNSLKGYDSGGNLRTVINAKFGWMEITNTGSTIAITGTSATGVGVKGTATSSGDGVRGDATTGRAVIGISTGNSGIAIRGEASGTSGIGVEGRSTNYFGGAFYGGTNNAPVFINPNPSLPTVGNINGGLCVYNNKLYFHNGTAWKEVAFV